MFASKRKTAVLFAAGALALSVPAVAGASIGLPGLAGAAATGPAPAPVGSITGSNSGVLGPDGPLGANGPLHGAGCVAPGVNPNSLGPDGPLGPHGPLALGGLAADFNCQGGLGLFHPMVGLLNPLTRLG
jgi:hypothetical protein